MGCSVSRTRNGSSAFKAENEEPTSTGSGKFCSEQLKGNMTPPWRGQQAEAPAQLPINRLNPRFPLNERQLLSVRNSWKSIRKNMRTTAVSMFIKLFETNLELKNQFEKFKDLKHVHDLRLAEGFEEHAMLVMCTLDEAINNLDDIPFVINMLRKTGRTHKRFYGFMPEHFYAVEEPFLQAVKEQLNEQFTLSIQVAFRQIIYFFLDTLVEGFKT